MSRPRRSQETGEEQLPPAETPAAGTAAKPKTADDLSESTELPWGYGVDRVGAMAVDPERLFVYWELTDDAIERARTRAGDVDAPVVLRVYEVTGRIFDGTNAHHHFDHEIDRSDRRWFFDIHRPGSEFVVELGLRLADDGFVKIARSARVEFPRAEAPAPSTPRWLTVRVREGRPEPVPEPQTPPPGTGERWPDPPRPSVAEDQPVTHSREPTPGQGPAAPTLEPLAAFEENGSPQFVTEQPLPVELQSEQRRVYHWEESARWSSWESGPSTTELEAPAPWTESYSGETRFFRDGPHRCVVTGPWEVVIRGLGAYRRREVLAHWEIHRSWITDEGSEIQREVSAGPERKPGSSERVRAGSSERRWQIGSEVRLSGSSELLYRGASERRLGGASELIFRGASESRLRGASERLRRGASERRLGGASEQIPRGASERRLGGASERLLRGASERRLGTAQARRQPEGVRAFPNVEDELDDE